ncbi:MAG: hypothetical protein ACREVE_06060 [Gammaproteobacteria bacterium]
MGTLSIALLENQVRKNDRDAMRALARLYLSGAAVPEGLNGKLLLIVAAQSGDRKAGWLLASYYRRGKHGFERNLQAAERWRDRTERRLRSDAWVNYLYRYDKIKAIQLYAQWRRWCKVKWPKLENVISAHDH